MEFRGKVTSMLYLQLVLKHMFDLIGLLPSIDFLDFDSLLSTSKRRAQ